jgi:hypothetical protein
VRSWTGRSNSDSSAVRPSNGWSIAVGSVPFVEFVTAHRHGPATVPPDLDGMDWRRTLASAPPILPSTSRPTS